MTLMAPVRPIVQRPYRISLPPGPPAAVEARRHVWVIVHTWDVPIDAYTAALLTSELVTEAISRDENAAVELMISWVDSQFRVEVRDGSRRGCTADAVPGTGSGRGLALAVNARRRLRLRSWPGQDRRGQ